MFFGALVVLLCVPSRTRAQPPAKQWRIGFIGSAPADANPEQAHLWDVFLQAMRERGYVEGTNYTLERRYHEGNVERFPQLARELVRSNVDIVIVGAAPGVRAAMEATSTIPIVMLATSDPVGAGLVASLAHPGGNVTGIADYQLDLVPKRLQLLKEAVPSVRRVVFLFGNYGGFSDAKIAAINAEQDAVAQSLGLSFLRVQMNTPEDFQRATEAILLQRPEALLLSPNTTNFLKRRDLADFAREHRLPTMTAQREHAVAGAMMSYGVSFDDLLRTTARFVDQILKGAKPADLPVEQPTKFDLIINLKTAKALGLTIPQSLLVRADEVIQ
jgi:putative ABC transport system substrate-binding protein